MAKKQTAPALPTFPKTPDFWGDEETGKPERLSPFELEDPDILPVVQNTLAQLEAWRAAQENPDEAEARQCYAENVARHLVGVFPNARISAEAYAAAAGEDLAEYSADIVRAMAQRARRTLKTLPPLAQLLEWCKAESEKRMAQLFAYRDDLREYRRTLEAGQREAAAIAESARCDGLQVSPEAVARVHRMITGHNIGIKPGLRDKWEWCARGMELRKTDEHHAAWRLSEALQRRLAGGEAEAMPLFTRLDALALRREALPETGDDSPPDHRALWDAFEADVRPVVAEAAAWLGLPCPKH
ncbi:MAG: hypothetical protein ING08_16015 [Roseomonas sp.]|nr:hypothetical protein [Roseomonas sp.]MCA3381738.1 hypothetical protein [Roseomonas sp.]